MNTTHGGSRRWRRSRHRWLSGWALRRHGIHLSRRDREALLAAADAWHQEGRQGTHGDRETRFEALLERLDRRSPAAADALRRLTEGLRAHHRVWEAHR